MLGFKSFADKMGLNFMPGITAIVGPNGCGKSNVADAIRWVLGEQSAKALRGGEMADVIFNGTDNRKALGLAEVSLTIGEVDQEHLRAAGVELDYNEVTLTRRVFRDGAGEYFLNKIPCRLKDIQQLFMGTGVGRTSYSIMAQGHITQLLSSRPEERRMVFEEAAGITRFKAQKKEALRKLESTEQNLLRVSDLIREVKRQIGSLQRQAGKARRYKQLMLELQHLDTQLARHQFDVLQGEVHERQTLAEKLRVEMEVSSAGVLREEDQITQLRQRHSELEHQINQWQQQGLELKGQIDRHEGRVHFNQERLRELEAQNSKALADIAQAEERRLAAEQERASVAERLASSTAALEQLRQTLQARQEALRRVETDQRARQDTLRQAQSEAFSIGQKLTRLRNEITALDLQKQNHTVRLEKLSAEKIQVEEERLRLEDRQREFATSVEAEQLSAQSHRAKVEEQQARLGELQQELIQVTRDLDDLLRRQAEQRSRLNVLEQLQAEHEGFSAGTLAALEQAPDTLGALVDAIRVPGPYLAAIEAALGHHLQLVLTQQPETAQQILADLKANKKGRASIAPLTLHSPSGEDMGLETTTSVPKPGESPTLTSPPPVLVSAENPAPPPADTCMAESASPAADGSLPAAKVCPPSPAMGRPEVMPALGVIEADTSIQPLLHRLLAQTFIVSDLTAATALWRESKGDFDWVTVAGEVLSCHGIYTGGSASDSETTPASLLGRKNQIAELQTQLAQLQDRISQVSRAKGALQGEQTALQASLQQVQTELRTHEVALATHQGEGKALDNAMRLLHQKVDTVVYEIQSLAAQEQEVLGQRQQLAAQLGEIEGREAQSQQQLANLNTELEGLRLQRDAAYQSLTETKVAMATEEQVSASFAQQQQAQSQRIQELVHLIQQRRGDIASMIERRSQLEAEIQDSHLKVGTLQHEREQVNARAAEWGTEKEALERDIAARDETLRNQRRRLSELQQQRASLEVELAQKNMATQNVRERIAQKYQVNLDNVRSECITITIADEGPAKVETLTPEEMASRGLATDWAAVSEQVMALQRRIDEMGPVNLVAIEEYEETEQRHRFLSTQYDDLIKAKAQLLEVINRINSQTREMFVQTFNQVRDNFNTLFTEIFGGGTADLSLVDEGDVLESGIEILARPPGKQLKSISLLSGGEQTMTAVALLFAIYQVKPSPFCVLDELDAPLDESNINRFIGVLKRFLTHSQFIIITHNKRTIGMADVIYGVTMQETGISKILSMKFHKTAGTLTDHPPGLAAAPSLPTPPPTRALAGLPNPSGQPGSFDPIVPPAGSVSSDTPPNPAPHATLADEALRIIPGQNESEMSSPQEEIRELVAAK